MNETADRTVPVDGGEISVEFRPVGTDLLAGGPIELDTVLRLSGGDPVTVTTSVERSTGRSRDHRFTADIPDGRALSDPYRDAVEMGGVQTSDVLTAQAPLRDTILLNQFLDIERLRPAIDPDSSVDVHVVGERRVTTEAGDGTARRGFTLRLRRDDAALAARLRQIAASINAAPGYTTDRARELLRLSTLRDPIAIAALRAVAGHPDPEVAGAVERALSALHG